MRTLLIVGAAICCLLGIEMALEIFSDHEFGDIGQDVTVILSIVPLVILIEPKLASNQRSAYILAALVEIFIIGLSLCGMLIA